VRNVINDMNGKNVAVIGSNGFIGGHLAQRLQQMPGINLFLFGRSEHPAVEYAAPYARIDLSNAPLVQQQFARIDLVYYLVSETIPSTSWENPVVEIEKNLLPFLNFMSAITVTTVKKVVFISSGGTVYGATHHQVNEDSATHPFSPYGINKLTMEHYLDYFRHKHGINFDIYRPSNVYGEGQNIKKGLGIINTFLENILSAHEVRIFGSGNNVRNFLYVKDLIDVACLSLNADVNTSEVYNVSSQDTRSLNELVDVMKKVVQEDFKVLHTPARDSDNSTIYLDNAKMTTALPQLAMTPIEEGIRKTYQHIKKELGLPV